MRQDRSEGLMVPHRGLGHLCSSACTGGVCPGTYVCVSGGTVIYQLYEITPWTPLPRLFPPSVCFAPLRAIPEQSLHLGEQVQPPDVV